MQKNTLEGKAKTKNGIKRLCFCAVCILLEVIFIVSMITRLNEYAEIVNLLTRLLGTILVLALYASDQTSSMKMPWIILILIFPIMGVALYLLIGLNGGTRKMRKRYEKIDSRLFPLIPANRDNLERLRLQLPKAGSISTYIQRNSSYPVYRNTDITYYDEAIKGLHAQLADLAKAEHFIFMEYHAIEEAEAFGRIKDVLAERAAHGVEVRLFYDDVGSIGFIDPGFIKRMEAIGVECRVFNPVLPILNIFMNNRDHRKITVVDGKIGYTGGYNLADEYFNITHPYGVWKDTGIRLAGDAVASLTVTFLQMWNATAEADHEFQTYFPKLDYRAADTGFVQPYADGPLTDGYFAEDVYLNLIKSAKHFFYAATPYLIISDDMTRELCLAAERGVDVRIVTPGIPDKKLVYQTTRSYYAPLVRRGVRIYEYTPGFIHQKQTLCDGETATVGTINFDYRSLYHHFENGVLLHGCGAIGAIGEDFAQIFEVSREVTEQYKGKRSMGLRIIQCILRLFAPLL